MIASVTEEDTAELPAIFMAPLLSKIPILRDMTRVLDNKKINNKQEHINPRSECFIFFMI